MQEVARRVFSEQGRPSPTGIRRNWHRFMAAGARLLLDVQSGSLHSLDEAAWDVLEAMEQGKDVGQVDGADDVIADLDALIAEGTLSCPSDADPMPAALGPGVVKAMCLNVSHDCNMRCGYCFAGAGGFGGERSLMPAQVGCRALDLLFDISGHVRCLDVDYFGGEPLMNMDAVGEITRHGRELEARTGKTLKLTLTTNCYELTPEVDKFLNDNDIAAVLSVDGRPVVHDGVRRTADGDSTFERIAGNMLRFVNTRPTGEYYARGTYTRRNLDFVEDVLFLADLGLTSISFEPVVAAPSSPYSIREQDLPRIFDSYDRLVTEMAARRAAGREFRFFHFDLNVAHGPCLAKRLLGCGAGREYVAVTPDGALYPCHQFVGREGFVMGNVWDGITRPEIGDTFAGAHIYAKPACRDCWARYMCSGGCHASAHEMNGTLMTPYSIGCLITRKRLEAALAYAALQGSSPA